MATQKDLFYRPDIEAPVKDSSVTGQTDKRVTDLINDLNNSVNNKNQAEQKIYASTADLYNEAKSSDATVGSQGSAIDALIELFKRHEEDAAEIKARLLFLIDMTIADMNADVSDAPSVVKQYIRDLTGIDVNNPDNSVLSTETIMCIMGAAGIKDPLKKAKAISLDDSSSAAMTKVTEMLGEIKKLDILFFGLTLLIIVLKLAYVIAVHHTVGYVCGFFKDKLSIGINKKIMKVRLKVKWKIGKLISKQLAIVERNLLKVVGYKCSKDKKPVTCNTTGDPSKIKINRVTCCTMNPIFFENETNSKGETVSVINSCFKAWIDAQLDPDKTGTRGTICGGSCKNYNAYGTIINEPVQLSANNNETYVSPLVAMFTGMTKDQLLSTLDSLNEIYDSISTAYDEYRAAYAVKIAQPDPVLPPLSADELKKLNTTEAERQAKYAAECKAKRDAWAREYVAQCAIYDKQLEPSEVTTEYSLADKIDYVTDLVENGKDNDVDETDYDDDDTDYTKVTPESCSPSQVEQAKAAVISDYLINNATSKTGVTDPGNISVCSQGIAKTDTATALSQQVQSSLNSAKQNVYTGNPNGMGDCFGFANDSTYAKYRGLSSSEREKAIEADLQNAINKAAQNISNNNTDSGTAIGSNSIFGYDGSGGLTDIMGVADKLATSLLTTADGIATKVAGMSRWLSSQQLCCVIYIMVFIVSIARVIAKGSDYTLCREKCKKCNGSGKIVNEKGDLITCPECNGSGYGKDLMDSATWVRNFMHVQWAKSAARNSNVQSLVALLKTIKQIVDIFCRKNKRSLLLTGLTIPLNEMFQLIKMVVATALSQFLDALFGPLDMALSSAQAIPEIRNMMNNECPILPDILKWLQCMLNGMKFGIITSLMKLFDANIQDIVIINDLMLCRQRMSFLDALSKLLDTLLKLIAGLKDCYDPGTLVDYIIEDVQENQYTRYSALLSILKDKNGVDMFNKCYTNPVMGSRVCFSEAEIKDIEAKPGNNNTGLGDLGYVIDKFNSEQDMSPLIVKYASDGTASAVPSSSLVSENASIVIPTYADFKKEAEAVSGVRVTEVRESMNEIYAILSGDESQRAY